MEDINLHFTGDMYAITVSNNLLSAAIDNHIHQGNEMEKYILLPWKYNDNAWYSKGTSCT